MSPKPIDMMASRFLRGQTAALGLSVVLFTFMLLPTLLVLLAVVAFFLLAYPRLQKSEVLDREQGVSPRAAPEERSS